MTRITRRGALALGTVPLLSALGLPGLLRAAPPKQIRIGWQKNSVVALARAGGDLETHFADRGIGIEWLEFTSGPPLLEALAAGALDFGHTGDVPPLFALAARADLVLAGQYESSAEGSAILVQQDSPIRSLADLKGRRLAFKRGSSAHNVALQLLRSAGLTLNDVTQVDLAPQDAATAFASGAIDAWSIWDPYTAAAQARPGTRTLATAEGVVPSIGFFSAGRGFAEDNGPLLAELLVTLQKRGAAAQDDLDGTVAAFAKATGLPPEILRTVATRKGADYGRMGPLEARHIEYEQRLADDFHAIGVLPRALDIRAAAWTPEKAS